MLKRVGLQLGFRTDPKIVIISCLISSYFVYVGTQKSEQRKLRKVLCLQGLHGTPRARMREEKSGEVRPGLYERERERERVQNYLELPNNLHYFFCLSSLKNLMQHKVCLRLYFLIRCKHLLN